METQQVIEWIGDHIVAVLVTLSVFIQIAPIKINPWSSLIKWVGKMLNGNLQQQVIELSNTIDENEKDRIRWQVLDFANSCRNGRRHTKDEFQHIITLNDKYTELLKRTNDKNGYFDEEYKYIKELFRDCQSKNNFL